MRTLLIDLPVKVKGFVIECEGEGIIVLNSRLSFEANQETYLHELEHLTNDDLNRECNVGILENLRHKKNS